MTNVNQAKPTEGTEGTGTKVPNNFADLDYNITQIERTKEDLYKMCIVEINTLRDLIDKMEKEQKEQKEKENEDVHVIATN